MFSFEEVCKTLNKAVCLSNVPNYEMKKNVKKDDCDVQNAVKFQYNRWKDFYPNFPELSYVGSCEINHFSGNELLRILFDIMGRDDLTKPGNLLFFSVNENYSVAIMFKQFFADTIGPLSPTEKNRFTFAKLFDDAVVNERKLNETYGVQYSDHFIKTHRANAAKEFPEFLKKKWSESAHFPYGYTFFGLLVTIAYTLKLNQQSDSAGLLRHIPIAACTRFSFTKTTYGKLKLLFGEVNCEARRQKNQLIVETAKELIFR